MDLMILIDSSSSMVNRFNDAKEFVRKVVDGLKIGSTDDLTRVTIAQFGSKVSAKAQKRV